MNHQDHDHYRRVIETSKERSSLLCELRVLGRQVELWTTEASIIWVIMMLVMNDDAGVDGGDGDSDAGDDSDSGETDGDVVAMVIGDD